MKYAINAQDDKSFEIKRFEVEEKEKTKNRLAFYVFYVCVFFLGIAAIYGAVHGDFGALKIVYENVTPPMNLILGYYFGSKNG